MQSNIPIFLSSDNNYAPFVATTIASICDNTKSFCEFYILDGGILKENQEKICELKNQFDNFSIEFISIDLDKYFKDFIETPKITKSMYSRFLIPYLKPEIDKAIYTDVDIIAFGDIQEMYNEQLNDFALGACYEEFFKNDLNLVRQEYLNLRNTHKYFSSGNLLFDCKKWRDDNILDKLMQLGKKYRQNLKYPDQDLLNKYFDTNYKVLDKKYCYVDPWFSIDKDYKFIIRHYTANYKPWKIPQNLELKEFPSTKFFWQYAQKTSFYEDIEKQSFSIDELNTILRKERFLKAYSNIVRRVNNNAK